MLEIMALATGVLVSFGAATVGSWAILEAVLRLAEPAARIKARRRERRERLRLLATATNVQDAVPRPDRTATDGRRPSA